MKKCAGATIILTDLGHKFDIALNEVFKQELPDIKRYVYYDNPEAYVPGGYSETAAKVMSHASKVIFSNQNLAKEPIFDAPKHEYCLPQEKRIGLGYYPVEHAAKLRLDREEKQSTLRKKVFEDLGIEDEAQKILVYFGGNNKEYFEKAFPAFLQFLNEASLNNMLILLQQYPSAKDENCDGKFLNCEKEKYSKALKNISISNFSSAEAQILQMQRSIIKQVWDHFLLWLAFLSFKWGMKRMRMF